MTRSPPWRRCALRFMEILRHSRDWKIKADIDDAITEILVSTDEERRQELYTFVLTRLHEDAVYIPLTYECNKAIYRSDLQGFHFTQTQYEVPFADFYFGEKK